MKLNKSVITAAVVAAISAPAIASADTINMSFTGAFTLLGGTGSINVNVDAVVPGVFDGSSGFDGIGSRTPISGTATFDTVTEVGSIIINPFSFFGNSLFDASPVTIQAIGDGFGGSGTLIAAIMYYDWNGSFNRPVTAILDASGFLGSIGAIGTSWSVETGCALCATSATPATLFGSQIGAIPIAMTTFNAAYDPAGPTFDNIFPLTDNGISGSPSTTAPISGEYFDFDFTTINATNVPQVPVPAATWLFSSGLVGLLSVAMRRRKNKD
ncbi:hypothetical protein MNBD_GAMMA05-609 [hydrothermal vent metagenome]|uniref:Uncharacterized protein n=1 Tax=hydrothermal vent metagenome TaxID=652676 RepID=A0A3B0W824_9ZZZZ